MRLQVYISDEEYKDICDIAHNNGETASSLAYRIIKENIGQYESDNAEEDLTTIIDNILIQIKVFAEKLDKNEEFVLSDVPAYTSISPVTKAGKVNPVRALVGKKFNRLVAKGEYDFIERANVNGKLKNLHGAAVYRRI